MTPHRVAARQLLLLCLLVVAACTGRPRHWSFDEASLEAPVTDRTDRPGKVIELDLSGGVPESTTTGGLLPLPASRTLVGLMRAVEHAGDGDADAVFVRLGGASLGWARTEEIGRLLGGLRAGGLPVVCHAHSLDNASAWLTAQGCDRIWLSPGGEVASVGIGAEVLYLKGALDKLNVRAQFLSAGKYKSAAEALTREGPSEAARESLLGTLTSIRQSWLDGMERARPGHDGLRTAMERGPWTANEAKARGLIDAVGFDTDAREAALDRGDASKTSVRFGSKSDDAEGSGIAELIRVLAGADDGPAGKPHVVVLPAQGAISMAPDGMFGASGISAKAMVRTLRELAQDELVKAVVLRIDSPGGSALASDLIWNELMRLRQKKPIVASVGDMAASGGYYLACAANRIVAERTSIVGSIGVVGGKIVFDAALRDLGVNTVTFAASPDPGAAQRAAYLSPLAPWDAATEARVQAHIMSIYDLFVQRVAKGRDMDEQKVRAVAEGRIWSGEQGHGHGLVDELGGLQRALAVARKLGKLGDDAPIRVEGAAADLLELLMLGPEARASEVAAAVQRLEARQVQWARAVPAHLRPFLATLGPLVHGEHILASLPFALVVR